MILGDRVEKAMHGAGIKARTFAEIVGCHYTTIYELLRNRNEQVPIRIVQEKVYDALEFVEKLTKEGVLPLDPQLSVAQKTEEVKRLYDSYKTNPPVV